MAAKPSKRNLLHLSLEDRNMQNCAAALFPHAFDFFPPNMHYTLRRTAV
jgi:hypothetical protein